MMLKSDERASKIFIFFNFSAGDTDSGQFLLYGDNLVHLDTNQLLTIISEIVMHG